MTGFAEYSSYDALGLAELVQKGEVSPGELVEECIARVERVNPTLNAVILTLYQQARAAAREPLGDGAFAGVPFLVKDLILAMPGVPTNMGSRFYRGWIPGYETTLWTRYREAGVLAVAKTNTPEFGMLPVTEPDLFGPTCSPWDTSRTSGGSSGGAGAMVAAGVVPMAHGGDGGGSIRIPSSCCGIFGLKPTRARTPAGPAVSENWNGFALEHVLTRTVRDSAAMLDATDGPEASAPYHAPAKERPFLDEVGADVGALRIGFHCEPPMPSEVHPDCIEAVGEVAKLCESLGHHVEEVRPNHDRYVLAKAFMTVVAANTAADLTDAQKLLHRRAKKSDFETETWLSAMMGGLFSAEDFVHALHVLQAESRRLVRELGQYDVILTPTLGQPPVPHRSLRAQGTEARLQKAVVRADFVSALKLPGVIEKAVERVYHFIPFTPVANFTGQPSMSVPLVWNRQLLPVGTMFTARFGDEACLFRLAAQLEEARPWKDRRPPVFSDPG